MVLNTTTIRQVHNKPTSTSQKTMRHIMPTVVVILTSHSITSKVQMLIVVPLHLVHHFRFSHNLAIILSTKLIDNLIHNTLAKQKLMTLIRDVMTTTTKGFVTKQRLVEEDCQNLPWRGLSSQWERQCCLQTKYPGY